MGALLMTLTQLKQGRLYAYTSRVFGCGSNCFCCLVETFILACADNFANYFITQPSMGHCQTVSPISNNFLDAIEAINVTFQRSYARGEDYTTKKIRWLGKHKSYGWKTKVGVGPDGKAWYVLPPYPGSFHNMKIFETHLDKHLACLVKEDADVKESNELSVNNNNGKNMWAALLDKGYKGLHKYGRFLTLKKKTACRDLDSDDKKEQQD